jgi:hypothetical protein
MKKIRIYTFKEKQELYDHISTLGIVDFHSIQLVAGEWERETIKTQSNFRVDKLTIKKYAIVEEIVNEDEYGNYEIFIKKELNKKEIDEIISKIKELL